MHSTLRQRLSTGAVVVAFGVGGFLTLGGVTSAHEGVAHPSHIHTGACPAPGEVLFPLTDVAESTGTAVGTAPATDVDTSVTTVQSTLADLTSSDHSIVVHESAENIGVYILCGNLSGPMMSDTDLAVGLAELNDSGASGVALLHDNGDGTTNVSVFVTQEEASEYATPDAGSMDGMDMGTPEGSMDMGTSELTVNIQNFSFGDPITVAVGTTVTFTNMDATAHTVTAKDGSFQSGSIAPGASWTHTFDTAGTFDFFCEFHANMSDTITVQ